MRAGLVVVSVLALALCGACSSGGGRSIGAFCTRVREMQSQNGAFDITNNTNTTAALDHSISQMQTISGVAPKEIEPDVQTIVNSLQAIKSGDTAAIRRSQEDFARATNNVAAYNRARCDIGGTTTTTK